MGVEAFVNGIAFPITADIKGLVKGLGQVDAKLTAQEQAFQRGTKVIQDWGIKVGLAVTGVGIAIEGLVKNAANVNADLGATGITLGKTTDEMRDLALETANAGFPLNEVVSTFDLLAKAGMRNTTEMQTAANAFDELGDAVGRPANAVTNALIPAFAAFDIPLTEAGDHLDAITYLTEHSTVTFDSFASVIGTLGTDLSGMGFTLEDTAALMLAMADAGIPGEKAMKKLRTAVSEYQQAQEDATKAAEDAIDIGKELAKQKEDLADLEKDYADALQKAGDTSKEVARIQLDYNKQVAASKKDLAELEEDYQKALKKAQDTTKDEAKLKKQYDKDLASSAKDSVKLEAEYAKEILKAGGDPEKIAAIDERYAEKRIDLQDRLSETTTDYNDRLLEIKDTSEAVASLNERYADQKESAQERINEQAVTYNERLTEAKDTTEAVAAVEERYTKQIADKNDAIAITAQELNDATAASVNAQSGMDALLTKINLTPEAYAAAQKKIADESAGATKLYADQNETRITESDKLIQKMDELTVAFGSSLKPLDGFGAALAVGGPIMMGLSGLLTTLPMLSGMAIPALSGALAFLAANPIVLVIAAIALIVVGLYVLEEKFHWIEAAARILGDAWAVIWSGISWVVQGAADLIGGTIDTLMSGIGWAFDNIISPIQNAWDGLWQGIKNTISGAAGFIRGIVDGIMNGIKWALNIGIDAINGLINGINRISFDVPSWLGGGTIGFNVQNIPRLAQGGVVTSPTVAMIGESGPEAVVPLSREGAGAGAGMGSVTIRIDQMNVRNDQDIKLIAQELHTLITRTNRGRGVS